MKTILFINPLKPGKLNEYKAFIAEITGRREQEYNDLLQRYHLKTAEVWYHQLGDMQYVIVRHKVDESVSEPLKNWVSSTHPFDVWFKEQLDTLHDMKNVTMPNLLLDHTQPNAKDVDFVR